MTDPQTPGLTEEQIAEMEQDLRRSDLVCPSCDGADAPEENCLCHAAQEAKHKIVDFHFGAALAEVRRLQALFQRSYGCHSGWVEAGMRTIRAEHERDAARAECERLTRAELDLTRKHQDTRAAFARAVELLRVLAYNANGQDIAHVSAARAFLAEHGGDR
jgi:hypothetical protein